MKDFIIEEYRETVGEVYNDEWSSDALRIVLDEWNGIERKISESSLISLINSRGYTLQDYGNSGHNAEVIHSYEKYFCAECENEAMFDTKELEYYCPLCDQ